jgi:hypothetical protein
MRDHSLSTLAVAIAAVAIAAMFLAPGAGQVIALTSGSGNTLHVIVFTNQDPQALNAVMKAMKDMGASNVKKLQLIGAVSGIVSSNAYQALKGMNAVASITEDHQRVLDPGPTGKGDGAVPEGQAASVDPYVEPEALNVTHADWGQSLGFSGQGIKVGFVDSGVDYKHPDLAAAIAAYVDTTGAGLKDEDGHGTGTASMVGAQGYYVYNSIINQYMQVKGMAPDAKIYEAKVFDKFVGWDSNIIAGIQWAVDNRVDILSCSVGTYDFISDGNDPVALAMEKAVENGVTVFVSAGNEGPGQGTVNTPGTARGVIAVGASTFYREFSQEGFLVDVGGQTRSGQVIEWSSRPPTADGRMAPDIMAPGAFGWALAPTYYLSSSGAKGVQEFGGTSQASPVAAGCTALLMSAYKAEISDTLPSPAWWANFIRSTATNLGYPGYDQTSGLINVSSALSALLERKPGFILNENEWGVDSSSPTPLTVTVKDMGDSAQQITVTPTVFSPMNDDTIIWNDQLIGSNSVRHSFSIPDGTEYMDIETTWSQGGPYVCFRNAVYDSEGAFVTYGPTYGGYGRLAQSTVSLTGPDPPAVGQDPWQVWIFPRGGMAPTTDTLVMTRIIFYQEMPGGWVDASASSVDLPAGGTASFTLSLNSNAPTAPGSYFTQVRVSNGEQTATIPVVLTVPVTIKDDMGSFDGSFAGSTVEYSGGEYYYFHFAVPADTTNIFATVSWEHMGNVVWIWLVSPEGKMMVVNGGGNDLEAWTMTGGLGIFDQTITAEQLTWTDPAPGEWMLGVFAGGFWGGDFSEEFTGTIALNADLFSPGSLSFTAAAGESSSQTLTVSNALGLASEDVFGMAMSSTMSAQTTATAKGNLAPSHNGAEDFYVVMVRPNTESLDLTLTWPAGGSPISLNLFNPAFSAAGSSVSSEFGTQTEGKATVTIEDPMSGLWYVFVDYYGTGNYHPVSYTLEIAMTAPQPCAWLSVSATPGSPLTIAPGASGDITVTVNVPSSAEAGTYMSAIYLNTPSGDRIGMVPVTLTVQ